MSERGSGEDNTDAPGKRGKEEVNRCQSAHGAEGLGIGWTFSDIFPG